MSQISTCKIFKFVYIFNSCSLHWTILCCDLCSVSHYHRIHSVPTPLLWLLVSGWCLCPRSMKINTTTGIDRHGSSYRNLLPESTDSREHSLANTGIDRLRGKLLANTGIDSLGEYRSYQHWNRQIRSYLFFFFSWPLMELSQLDLNRQQSTGPTAANQKKIFFHHYHHPPDRKLFIFLFFFFYFIMLNLSFSYLASRF